MLNWARKNPVAAFLLMGFGGPWLGWTVRALLFADEPSGMWQWSIGSTALYYSAAGLLVGGFVMSYVLHGPSGLWDIWKRFFRWRVPIFWWLYAFLAPFVVSSAAIFITAAISGVSVGAYEPWHVWRYASVPFLLLATTGPLCEEAGWRGFLLPKFMETQSALTASLLIGALWTVWHYPLSFMPGFVFEFLHTASGFAFYFATALVASIHHTIVYLNARQSILLVMVFHWAVQVVTPTISYAFPDITNDMWSNELKLMPPVLAALIISVTAIFIFRYGPGLRNRKTTEEASVTDGGD